jgi:hypothetical protein
MIKVLSSELNYDPVISFRCTPKDKQRLVDLAAEKRMNISSLVKAVLFANLDWFEKATEPRI